MIFNNYTTEVNIKNASELPLNETSKEELTAYIAAEISIAILVFISNSLVLIAVFKFEYLHSVTHRLIASLAVADLLVAILGIPSAIMLRIGLELSTNSSRSVAPDGHTKIHKDFCLTIIWMVVTITQVSIFHLLLIAVDRYIAIKYSLRYYTLVNSQRVRVFIALAWLFGGVVGFTPLIKSQANPTQNHCTFESVASMEHMVFFNFFLCVLLPLVCLFILYAYIFRSAKTQLKKIYNQGLINNSRHQSFVAEKSPTLNLINNDSQIKLSKLSPKIKQKTIEFSKQFKKQKMIGVNESNLDSCNREGDICIFDEEKQIKFVSMKHHTDNNIKLELSSTNSSLDSVDKEYDYLSSDGTRRSSTILARSIQRQRLKRTSRLIRKEFRAARSLFLAVGLFSACWLPLHIHNCLLTFTGMSPNTTLVTDCFILLSHANSLMNPFVYAFRMREWRRAFHSLLKKAGTWISGTIFRRRVSFI